MKRPAPCCSATRNGTPSAPAPTITSITFNAKPKRFWTTARPTASRFRSSHTFLSDGEVAVKDSSFGATCAPNGEVFSKEYLDAAKAAGTDGYISADKKIDASTCRYPDQTWFVKNCSHNNIHTITRTLQLAFLRSGGTLTIHDDVTLPQYFFCDEGMGTYGPLTEDNAPYTEMFDYMGPIRARLNFAKALFQFIGHRLKLAFEAAGDTLKKK